MQSLRSRLLLTYLVVAGLVLVLLAASLAVFLAGDPVAVRDTYRRMDLVSQLLVQRETRPFFRQGAGRLRQMLGRLQLPLARIAVVDSGGAVVVDSEPEAGGLPASVLSAAPGRGEVSLAAGEYLYTVTDLEDGGALVLVMPAPEFRLASLLGDDLGRPFLRAGILALAVSIVLAWLISGWVSRPLRDLAGAARGVAGGDYTVPTEVRGPSEVRQLGEAFGEMVDRVRASQQSQRDFVANISHELKTPLTSIQGFAQALRDGAAGGESGVRRAGSVIFDESNRMRRLVDDLLELARLDAGQIILARESVDLRAVIAGVVERLSLTAAERRVRLTIDLPALPAVIGDGDRLAQVFTNLIENAVRHSPPESSVDVRGVLQGPWVSLSVEDSGPGIPADELSRIFERFYQVDKARAGGVGRGTGLGLAISREIVEAHGGRITAESLPGRGSRFAVHLRPVGSGDTTVVRRRRI